MARLSKDDYYLNIAKAVSLRSTCLRRCYGAILVKNKEIIATGYNGAPRGAVNCCDTGFCARDAENAPHNKGYLDTCLAGDSVIKLLNGTYCTIRELAEKGKSFWTYSVDIETGKIVPSIAHSPRRTGTRNDMYRITFHDKTSIVCTSDHRIMLTDGTYKCAQDLRKNDSVMSLYYSFLRNQGYESISNIGRKGSGLFTHPSKFMKCNQYLTPTHQLVYEYFYGYPVDGYQKVLIHHQDHNRLNNEPSNLILVKRSEHSKHHVTEEQIQRIISAGDKGRETLQRLIREDDDFRLAMSERGRRDMTKKWASEEWREYIKPIQSLNGKQTVKKLNSPEMRYRQCQGRILKGLTYLFGQMSINNDTTEITSDTYETLQQKYTGRGNARKHNVPKLNTILKYYQNLEFALEEAKTYNHRVIKVQKLTESMDVYDVTVPFYQNFPVDLGNNSCVIVHNCPSIHAETNCLLNVRRQDAVGSTLYLYGYDRKTEKPVVPAEPCVMCKRLLQNCGVARVVGYGAQEQYYDFLDAVTDAAGQISEDEELVAKLHDALSKIN